VDRGLSYTLLLMVELLNASRAPFGGASVASARHRAAQCIPRPPNGKAEPQRRLGRNHYSEQVYQQNQKAAIQRAPIGAVGSSEC